MHEQLFDERALRSSFRCASISRVSFRVRCQKPDFSNDSNQQKTPFFSPHRAFWQGVDVRGEQLSCVIIDKLPFAVPSDPIVAARTKFIDENGGKSFFDYSRSASRHHIKTGNRKIDQKQNRQRRDRAFRHATQNKILRQRFSKFFTEN